MVLVVNNSNLQVSLCEPYLNYFFSLSRFPKMITQMKYTPLISICQMLAKIILREALTASSKLLQGNFIMRNKSCFQNCCYGLKNNCREYLKEECHSFRSYQILALFLYTWRSPAEYSYASDDNSFIICYIYFG